MSAVPASSSSSCLGLWHLRENTEYTLETFSTKPEALSIELRMCQSRFIRQNFALSGNPEKYPAMNTSTPASLGFHSREKGA